MIRWVALGGALLWAGQRLLQPERAALDRSLPAFLRDEARRALQKDPQSASEAFDTWVAAELPVTNPSLTVHAGGLWLAGRSPDGWRLLELDGELRLRNVRECSVPGDNFRLCSWRGRLLGLDAGRGFDLLTDAEVPVGPGVPLVQGQRLRYLRGLDPVQITGREAHRPRLALDHLEPSTQVIRFGSGWLLLAREVALHRFVFLGDGVRVTPPFFLGERCHGLSRQPGHPSLLLSYERGGTGYLGRLPTRRVAELLELC